MSFLSQIEAYQPWNEQESADREVLLARMRRGEELYTRANPDAHLTASAWVVSPDRKQVLMAYHNLYGSWAWLGGPRRRAARTFWRQRCGKCRRRAASQWSAR